MSDPKVVIARSERPFWQSIFLGASQKVTIGASSTQSTAVGARIIRLYATQDCHVKTGTNPTAVADGSCLFLPQGFVEFLAVEIGYKVAVIQDSAGGTLYISEAAGA